MNYMSCIRGASQIHDMSADGAAKDQAGDARERLRRGGAEVTPCDLVISCNANAAPTLRATYRRRRTLQRCIIYLPRTCIATKKLNNAHRSSRADGVVRAERNG